VLPPLTPDLGGAASMLEPLGGLVVFHDAAGCLENYVVYDEPRLAGSGALVCSSALTAIDAITGNDVPLTEGIITEAERLHPSFAAIIGTPVPAVTAVDLEGIAAAAEQQLHLPVLALSCSGFDPYWKGAGEALLQLVQRFAEPADQEVHSINLLGATPLDLSESMLAHSCSLLKQVGWHVRPAATMHADIEALRTLSAAELNLVVSRAGLPAAEYLQQKFGTPYRCLLPLSLHQANTLNLAEDRQPGGEALIAAEPILAASIADLLLERHGIRADLLPLEAEEDTVRETLQQHALVFADPLYRPLCRKGTHFYPLPHAARSSHLFDRMDPMFTIGQILGLDDITQGGNCI
jgi:nitrogenase molybdenum-iron protein alpha/beta subunit